MYTHTHTHTHIYSLLLAVCASCSSCHAHTYSYHTDTDTDIAVVWYVSHTNVTWLIHMYDMTHSYAWHDSFICATWLIPMCDMTHSYVCLQSEGCDMPLTHTHISRLIHTCDMSHSHVWNDAFICSTWLIHMVRCTHEHMTHSYVWHDSSRMWMRRATYMNEPWHVCARGISRPSLHKHIYDWVVSHIWMNHVINMNKSYSYVWRESFVLHTNEPFHIHEWVMARIWMRHVTSHVWMSHVKGMDESDFFPPAGIQTRALHHQLWIVRSSRLRGTCLATRLRELTHFVIARGYIRKSTRASNRAHHTKHCQSGHATNDGGTLGNWRAHSRFLPTHYCQKNMNLHDTYVCIHMYLYICVFVYMCKYIYMYIYI